MNLTRCDGRRVRQPCGIYGHRRCPQGLTTESASRPVLRREVWKNTVLWSPTPSPGHVALRRHRMGTLPPEWVIHRCGKALWNRYGIDRARYASTRNVVRGPGEGSIRAPGHHHRDVVLRRPARAARRRGPDAIRTEPARARAAPASPPRVDRGRSRADTRPSGEDRVRGERGEPAPARRRAGADDAARGARRHERHAG